MGLICATRWAEYADTREEDEMPARELLSRYSDVDVVIIEGYKTEGFDNIVVALRCRPSARQELARPG